MQYKRKNLLILSLSMSLLVIATFVIILSLRPSEEDRLLEQADAIMEANPDSSSTILKAIKPVCIKSDRAKALYNLLICQGKIKTYLPLEGDSSKIKAAVNYFKKDKTPIYLIRALYYQSYWRLYENSGEISYAEIISDLLEAREIAVDNGETYWLARCDDLLNDIYTQNYNSPVALTYSRNAAEEYKECGKILNHRYLLCDYAAALWHSQYNVRAIHLLDSILDVARNIEPDSALAAYSLRLLVQAYYENNDSESSIAAFNLLKSPDINGTIYSKDYSMVSRAFTDVDRLDEASLYAEKAMIEATDKADSALAYNAGYEIAYKIEDYKNAVENLKKYVECVDREAQIALNEVPMQAEKYFLKNTLEKTQKALGNKIWLVILFAVIIIVICLAISYYFYRRALLNKKIKIEEYLQSIKDLENNLSLLRLDFNELEKSKNEKIEENAQLYEQNKNNKDRLSVLSSEIEDKEDKLSAFQNIFDRYYSILNTLLLNYYQQLVLEEEEGKLDNQEENVNPYRKKLLEKKRAEYNEKRKSIFKELKKGLANITTSDFEQEIESIVEFKYPGKLKGLKDAKGINVDEVKVAMYSLAGLSPRSIALITGTKEKSTYSRRIRLREKIAKMGLDSADFWIRVLSI